MPRSSPYTILLSDEERRALQAQAAKYTAPYFEVLRAKIVLYAADGLKNQAIGPRLDLPRFDKRRLRGLKGCRARGAQEEATPARASPTAAVLPPSHHRGRAAVRSG